MENEFLIIDTLVTKRGKLTTESKECDGRILIKQFTGVNSENFVVKNMAGKKLEFSFFKLNGVYYVNLNGQHIIDYKKFVNIQSICNVDNENGVGVKFCNVFIGEIFLPDCDVEIFHKALNVMDDWIRKKTTWVSEFLYFLMH